MNRTEYHHNSEEQVEQYLRKALAMVKKLEPDDDLRGLVFAKAVELYSNKQIVMEQLPTGILGGLNRGS